MIILNSKLHRVIEMSECGKNYQNFVFKSDNQNVMSRNIITFLTQIDNNNLKILYEGFKNLHIQFLLWNSPGLAFTKHFQDKCLLQGYLENCISSDLVRFGMDRQAKGHKQSLIPW